MAEERTKSPLEGVIEELQKSNPFRAERPPKKSLDVNDLTDQESIFGVCESAKKVLLAPAHMRNVLVQKYNTKMNELLGWYGIASDRVAQIQLQFLKRCSEMHDPQLLSEYTQILDEILREGKPREISPVELERTKIKESQKDLNEFEQIAKKFQDSSRSTDPGAKRIVEKYRKLAGDNIGKLKATEIPQEYKSDVLERSFNSVKRDLIYQFEGIIGKGERKEPTEYEKNVQLWKEGLQKIDSKWSTAMSKLKGILENAEYEGNRQELITKLLDDAKKVLQEQNPIPVDFRSEDRDPLVEQQRRLVEHLKVVIQKTEEALSGLQETKTEPTEYEKNLQSWKNGLQNIEREWSTAMSKLKGFLAEGKREEPIRNLLRDAQGVLQFQQETLKIPNFRTEDRNPLVEQQRRIVEYLEDVIRSSQEALDRLQETKASPEPSRKRGREEEIPSRKRGREEDHPELQMKLNEFRRHPQLTDEQMLKLEDLEGYIRGEQQFMNELRNFRDVLTRRSFKSNVTKQDLEGQIDELIRSQGMYTSKLEFAIPLERKLQELEKHVQKTPSQLKGMELKPLRAVLAEETILLQKVQEIVIPSTIDPSLRVNLEDRMRRFLQVQREYLEKIEEVALLLADFAAANCWVEGSLFNEQDMRTWIRDHKLPKQGIVVFVPLLIGGFQPLCLTLDYLKKRAGLKKEVDIYSNVIVTQEFLQAFIREVSTSPYHYFHFRVGQLIPII